MRDPTSNNIDAVTNGIAILIGAKYPVIKEPAIPPKLTRASPIPSKDPCSSTEVLLESIELDKG
jgi:hypothetical protein